MNKRFVYLLIVLCFMASGTAHAVSLNGLMGIDAGQRTLEPALDENGDPVLDTDGEPITVPVYHGGSYFSMGGDNPRTGAMLAPGAAGGITLGAYQPFILNPDEPHPAGHPDAPFGAGSGYATSPTEISTVVAPFAFFFNLTYVGTNPVGYQSAEAHPAPSAEVDLGNCTGSVCALTMDLSSWEVMWNGTAFEQGPRPDNTGPFVLAIGTIDMATNFYSISWESQIKGGSFNNVLGFWHLEGTFTPVPVPGALLLLATGLVGVFGGWCRRRAHSF
jgi:hypothetical protein